MNYIDLFAGAGGLSEGFIRAGCSPVAHIEMNIDAINTIKTRISYYYLKSKNKLDIYNKYLEHGISRDELYSYIPKEKLNTAICVKLTEENIEDVFNEVDKNIKKSKEIDFIVGGPPCQAYSLVGRSIKIAKDKMKKKNNETVVDDPRNYLYKLYFQFLSKYKPKAFVFENVTGLLNAQNGMFYKDFAKLTESIGYNVDNKILKAEDYGVLQSRRRVIIVGWRSDINEKYPKFRKRNLTCTLNEMLSDLPKLNPGEENNNYQNAPCNYLIQSGIRTKNDNILTEHICRPHLERDREIYRHVINAWNNGHKRLHYDELPENLKTHKNRKSFIDRFKVVEGDTNTCHTMMAHISKDGHYFIHPDIQQARSLSVREAARIQSFPDNYYFEGSRTAAFTQIGNAVPPLMAEVIAKELVRILKKHYK